MNLRMRMMCLPALLALASSVLWVLPAKAQQESAAPPDQASAAEQANSKNPAVEVASNEADANLPTVPAANPAPEATAAPVATAAAESSSAAPQVEGGATPPATDQGTTPATTPAAAAPPVWSLGPIDFSGTIDGYYGFNFNHPRDETASSGSGNAAESNFLYNFNVPTNQFSLNLIKLGMSHSPDPVGFEFDLGYGDAMNIIGGSFGTTGSEFDRVVEQAYVSFKPAKAKGFEIDFGKFVTSASAEVIESYSNWDYSRSLLFSYAVPYYHFGIRTSFPMGKHWTGGIQVVNGWNNDTAFNAGATIGANATLTYAKFNWVVVWYGGPGNYGTNSGWRDVWDTTLNFTPSSKFSAYINYDYDYFRSAVPLDSGESFVSFGPLPGIPNNLAVHWQGIAAAAHFTPVNKWAFTARYEYFDDPDGAGMLGASLGSFNQESVAIPVSQHVQEITGTVEYKFLEGLMWRGEYRIDWSDEPFFLTGFEPADPIGSCSAAECPSEYGLGNSNHQQTLTFAVIAFFGPKR